MFVRLLKLFGLWLAMKMSQTLMRPPKFDFWFWALVVYALFIPSLFDGGHIQSCHDRHETSFINWRAMLWLEPPKRFKCEYLYEEWDKKP